MNLTVLRRGSWIALLLAVQLSFGCALPDQGEEDSTVPGDTLGPIDSIGSPELGPSEEVFAGDSALGDSVASGGDRPAIPTTARESGPGAQEPGQAQASSLQGRVDRLEAENDSLRAAVGTLLNALGSEEASSPQSVPDSTSPDSSGVTSPSGQVRLTVEARRLRNWAVRIAVAVIFLSLVGLLIRMVAWVLDRLAERNARSRLFFKRLVPIARISFWFLASVFCALVILNIQARGLLAAGAAVGVAVGFAAQDIIKNIFGGIIVLFDQSFQVGDKISVGGTYGEVVSIGLRSTRIVTPDDNRVTVPNSQVVDQQVANANSGELNCQVVTDLYLPGWVDESQAKRIAFEAASSSKYVYLNKPIVVLVKDEFKETFLTHLKVKAYVMDPRYEALFMSDVTERARAGFRKAGLIGPMHGARAYIDLDKVPSGQAPLAADPGGGEG
ncbi:MAG: mechanosensitive ion channel family protein [Longimicrobiales bacterium]